MIHLSLIAVHIILALWGALTFALAVNTPNVRSILRSPSFASTFSRLGAGAREGGEGVITQ